MTDPDRRRDWEDPASGHLALINGSCRLYGRPAGPWRCWLPLRVCSFAIASLGPVAYCLVVARCYIYILLPVERTVVGAYRC